MSGMDLSKLKPPAGFVRFHGRILRTLSIWLKMLGVAVLIQAAFDVIAFWCALAFSESAAGSLWAFVVRHPIIATAPGCLGALWVYLCECHRRYNLRIAQIEIEKESIRQRAAHDIMQAAEFQRHFDRLKSDCESRVAGVTNQLR